MPGILPRKMDGFWPDDGIEDPGAFTSVLTADPHDALELYEVFTPVTSLS